MRVIRSPEAAKDVLEIIRFIKRDDAAAAKRVLDAIDETINFLGDIPYAGRDRSELSPRMRSAPAFRYRNYLVFYRIEQDTVEIVRVLHGARDLRRIFKKRRGR